VATSNITNQDGLAANGAIDLVVNGGNAPYGYHWEGPSITGSNENIQDPGGLVAGSYSVTVTDAEGCQTTHSLTIININPPLSAVSETFDACEGDGCIDVTVVSPTSPPFVISWSGQESGTKTTLTYNVSICELTPGPYTVTVTDINNISYTFTPDPVGQRPPVSLTSGVDQPDQAQSNGSVTLTASPGLPLVYNWIEGTTGNSPIIVNLDEGHYCVEVTNALPNGCSKIYCFDLIRQYDAFVGSIASTVNPTCAGLTNGAITLQVGGGAAPYTYAWSNGATTSSLTGAGQGNYSVTITDQRDSVLVFSGMTLTSASQLTVSNVNELSNYNGYQVAGPNNCNGIANAVVSGANGNVSYAWSNGISGAMNTTLCGGTYTVTVTDGSGCTSTWTGELTVPDVLTPTFGMASDYNGFNVSCNGKCDGAARVQINGGVAPYTIEWPNGEVDIATGSTVMAEADDLCAGTYDVTITDNNNNELTMPITLTEPDSIVITFSDIEPTNLATCNAEIIAEATNLVGDAEWVWSSQFHQGTSQRAEDLCSDELVTFIVIDANGCRATATHLSPFPVDECFKPNPIMTPTTTASTTYLTSNASTGCPIRLRCTTAGAAWCIRPKTTAIHGMANLAA
jgi:hypothetical protein